MEYQEQSIEDRSLDDRARSRFEARDQEQVTLAEWLVSVEGAHEEIADRRIVEVSGAMACAELQSLKYDHALRLMSRVRLSKQLTISEWRDGRVGKRTIDNYMRDIMTSECSNDERCGADYTEVCMVMNKLMIGDGYEVVITNEPSAFLRMGCQSIDNNSCYRAHHECALAPLVIAENRGSFIGYIKDTNEDKVIARCWGIERDGAWFFTNVYSRGIMTYTASAVFTAALRVVCNTPDAVIVKPTIQYPHVTYLNGDIKGTQLVIDAEYVPRDYQWTMHDNDMQIEERIFCDWCEEHCICDPDDANHAEDIGTICECCRTNDFVWSEYSDTYIVTERATQLHDGEYCPSHSAIELYDGEFATDDEEVTLIMHGSHADQYALDDDCDLRYTPCCNEAYIEGSI